MSRGFYFFVDPEFSDLCRRQVKIYATVNQVFTKSTLLRPRATISTAQSALKISAKLRTPLTSQQGLIMSNNIGLFGLFGEDQFGDEFGRGFSKHPVGSSFVPEPVRAFEKLTLADLISSAHIPAGVSSLKKAAPATSAASLISNAPVLASVATIGSYIANTSPSSAGGRHFAAGSTVTVNLTGLQLAGEVNFARTALAAWARVANIKFIETTGTAQITLTDDGNNTTYDAYTSVAWSNATAIDSAAVHITQYWYNHNGGAGGPVGVLNSYGYQTFVHELGHALGLGHTGPYNGTATYGTSNIFTNDSWQYSVMSYFDQTNYGGSSYAYITSAMQSDIYGVQLLYGTPTGPVNHKFGFGSNTGSEFDLAQSNSFTMYSGDGIANLDASLYGGAQTVHFNAGSFSSVKGLTNNVGLALNTHLTGYAGGSGSDTIFFGGAANGARSATGGAGNDYFYADGTSDSVNSITADGGTGTDIFDAQGTISGYTFQKTSQTNNGWVLTKSGAAYDNLTNIETARFTTGDVTLRQARSNFNFGAASGDVGSTSDFLLYNSSGQIVDWLMQGNSTVASNYLGQYSGWTPVATGDFNGDGISDFVGNKNGYLVDYQMNSLGKIQNTVYLAYVPGWNVVGTGDYNNDGRTDIVLQNGGTIITWIMGASGAVASTNSLGNVAGTWNVAATGDFNGDGRADTLLRNSTTGDLVEWFTNAAGTVGSSLWLGQRSDLQVVGSGDFDGNGTSDLLMRDNNGQLFTWLTNTAGQISATHSLGTPAGWTVAGTGDYNGDGIADVALQKGGSLVQWTLNSGGQLASSNVVTLTGANGWTVLG